MIALMGVAGLYANELPLFMRHALLDNGISLEELNAAIRHYGGFEECTHWLEIKATHLMDNKPHLRWSAMQYNTFMRHCLVIFYPFVVRLRLEETSKKPLWDSLVCLSTVHYNIYTPEFTKEQMIHTEKQLEWHDTLYISAYGRITGIPKHHGAMHLPMEAWGYGPQSPNR